MKVRVQNYIFNTGSNQITFSDYTQVKLESVLLITNVTSNVIIYNFADPLFGGTVSGNVLTLDYNTSGMNNSDALLIYYDNADIPSTNAAVEVLQDQNALLRRMVKLLEGQGTVDINKRQRVAVETMPTVGINGIVTSGLTAQAGNSYPDTTNPYILTSRAAHIISEFPVGQEWRIADSARNTFANGIRSKIT